jgi:CubicO group peptidase (beta-lactamase class C family)
VVAAAPLLFTPGKVWAYSNSGYMVLGAVYLSITDLARWDQALRRGEVLSAESREHWWTPAKLDGGVNQS